jgi:hypothetical protein
MEISVLLAFVASENDAGCFPGGQFVHRSTCKRNLLISAAQLSQQGGCPIHLVSY